MCPVGMVLTSVPTPFLSSTGVGRQHGQRQGTAALYLQEWPSWLAAKHPIEISIWTACVWKRPIHPRWFEASSRAWSHGQLPPLNIDTQRRRRGKYCRLISQDDSCQPRGIPSRLPEVIRPGVGLWDCVGAEHSPDAGLKLGERAQH